ncbi:hypothetical protein GCM10010429_57210 [Micromonospora olivasterospora]
MEKVISRVPKDPLSITAVRDSVPRECSVMVRLCSFASGAHDARELLRRPVFDRSARGAGGQPGSRGPLPETGTLTGSLSVGRAARVWFGW